MRRREFCQTAGGLALAAIGLRCGSEVAVEEEPKGLENHVEIFTEGAWLRIVANGIPDHAYGMFPNAHDPEPIRPQTYDFRAALRSEKAAAPRPLEFLGRGFSLFGVAINGVPFDPVGPWYREDNRSGWLFEVMSDVARPALGLDDNNAHTQAGGRYHYHGLPVGLIERAPTSDSLRLVGWAADGFPVYYSPSVRPSYRLREGTRPTAPGGKFDGVFVQDYEWVLGSGDLDECNGRDGATPEYPDGTYHYFITSTFPFIPRLFRGTPHESFSLDRGGGLMGPPRSGPLPPELWAYVPAR